MQTQQYAVLSSSPDLFVACIVGAVLAAVASYIPSDLFVAQQQSAECPVFQFRRFLAAICFALGYALLFHMLILSIPTHTGC